MSAFQTIALLALRLYRAIVSPVLTAIFGPLGFGCRYTPTCSQYAMQAVRAHGTWTGSLLAVRRICRCHPWGGSGYDPVPRKSTDLHSDGASPVSGTGVSTGDQLPGSRLFC